MKNQEPIPETSTPEASETATLQGSDEVIAKKNAILAMFAKKGASIAAVSAAVNISRQTFYRWQREDEAFRTALHNVREGLLDFAEAQLYQLIAEKNVTALIFFLKCKGKERGYVEKSEIDHTTKGEAINAPITLVVHSSSSKLLEGKTNLTVQL